MSNQGKLTFTDTKFLNNYAKTLTNGIISIGSHLVFKGCEFNNENNPMNFPRSFSSGVEGGFIVMSYQSILEMESCSINYF